jgi:uncharacterized damage-inducible protein DinB
MPFPDPSIPIATRAEVLLGYLDYYRSRLADKLEALPEGELRSSRLPSGWTPAALANHLTHVELRWLEWGFEGQEIEYAIRSADRRDERFYVADSVSLGDLLAALAAQGARTRAIVQSHDLADIGQPGLAWEEGQPPPALERILLHLIQEYARHVGQLDVVSELAGGEVGE